jgi:hypothetical protein
MGLAILLVDSSRVGRWRRTAGYWTIPSDSNNAAIPRRDDWPWVYHQIALVLAVFVLATAGSRAEALDRDWALTLYFGRYTDARAWHDIFLDPDTVDFVDTYLVAAALARTFARCGEGSLSFELEGSVVRHFGDEHLWEFNLPVVARWQRFPWDTAVATTAAYGLGPSYTTKVPPLEAELDGSSQRFLFYWFIEVTLGPPEANWSASLRLHHRSGGFGSLADEGSADALTAGIRFEF